jgi:predicted cobalt transporter CbtA
MAVSLNTIGGIAAGTTGVILAAKYLPQVPGGVVAGSLGVAGYLGASHYKGGTQEFMKGMTYGIAGLYSFAIGLLVLAPELANGDDSVTRVVKF